MALKQNVGIDISKDKFDVHIGVLENDFGKKCLGRREFSNTGKGFLALSVWVEKHKLRELKASYTIEFTGVYYEQLAYYLRGLNNDVHMVIPSKAKRFAQSQSYASKTDRSDAQSLAWMGLERKLKKWEPISNLFLDIRVLTREREELIKERTAVKNQLHATREKALQGVSTNKRYIQRLELINQQVEEIEGEIDEIIKSDNNLNRKVRIVETIPGVGRITVATILAESNGFAAVKNQKQLTSYAGLDVKFVESGKYSGKTKISKQGNAHIRRVLYFPAFTASIYNPQMKSFFDRLVEAKAKKMIANTAVQRKMLCLMFSIWKSEKGYDKDYQVNQSYREDLKVRAAQKNSPAQDIDVDSFEAIKL